MPDWGFTVEEMEDPDFSLNFAAEKISEGKEYLWTVCSCMQFAKAMGVKFPRYEDGRGLNADEMFPNTDVPIVGGAIIMKYRSGVHHVIPILKDTLQADGIYAVSANKEPCKITREFISYDDPNIMGYYRYANGEK